MIRWAAAFAAAAAAFLALDAVWLTTMSARLYRPIIGAILAPQPRLAPAIAFYVVYIAGIVAIAVRPAVAQGSWRRAAGGGALLGFVAYATYDLTSQATLSVWSTRITLLDLGWGTLVTTVGAIAGYGAARRLSPG